MTSATLGDPMMLYLGLSSAWTLNSPWKIGSAKKPTSPLKISQDIRIIVFHFCSSENSSALSQFKGKNFLQRDQLFAFLSLD